MYKLIYNIKSKLIILSLLLFYPFFGTLSVTTPTAPLSISVIRHRDILFEAISLVESQGNPSAIGTKGDGGVLQILPKGRGGMLDEANRILSQEVFVDSDRFSKSKSKEMWMVVMNKKNPSYNIVKAAKIHNPKAPKSYLHKIIKAYNYYVQIYKSNNFIIVYV